MAGWHTRVTGVVLAVILAGMPGVSLACALACSGDSSAVASNHSHHGTMAHHDAETGTAIRAAYQPACCRDVAALAAFVAVARFDGKLSSVIALSLPTICSTSPPRMSAHADRHGVAPPGGSFQIVQRADARRRPLRI